MIRNGFKASLFFPLRTIVYTSHEVYLKSAFPGKRDGSQGAGIAKRPEQRADDMQDAALPSA
ncbi:hypothetical protein CE91St32_16310 [Gordonibacter pamelaeae]|nr:hypothetical protein CE91St32_16310 [Gordonibacter pamelaeae]